jgi:hypothetical protein
MFKQFICNVFAAVLNIPLPTINEQSCCVVLHCPPNIPVVVLQIAVLQKPPPIIEQPPITVFPLPPLIVE